MLSEVWIGGYYSPTLYDLGYGHMVLELRLRQGLEYAFKGLYIKSHCVRCSRLISHRQSQPPRATDQYTLYRSNDSHVNEKFYELYQSQDTKGSSIIGVQRLHLSIGITSRQCYCIRHNQMRNSAQHTSTLITY